MEKLEGEKLSSSMNGEKVLLDLLEKYNLQSVSKADVVGVFSQLTAINKIEENLKSRS